MDGMGVHGCMGAISIIYSTGFLSGNVSRGGKFSHEEYVGGKSKAL